MTREMKPVSSWRETRVTVSLLLILISAACALAAWVMPKVFVPRTEVSDKLHTIDLRLDRMEIQQTAILREVRKANGHGRRTP